MVDETAFQQLLSAAYVMQEHNNRLKKAPLPTAQVAVPVSVKPAVVTSPSVQPTPFSAAPLSINTNSTCQECGSALALHEFFCENCAAPVERSGNTTQKNWASLWEMHQSSPPETKVTTRGNRVPLTSVKTVHPEDATDEEIDLFPAELEEIVGKFSPAETDEELEPETDVPEIPSKDLILVNATAQPSTSTDSNVIAPASSTWTSAAKARAWLDSLKAPSSGKEWFREEWSLHRGIICIALASAVLLAVLFQWTTQPAATPGQPRELSGFEQMLVSLGLAEAPTPSDTPAPGNPNTKVWVDVHTALYYCPGANLYGKAADGKYTTQLDAQRDHFQPSTLKACD